MAWRERGEKQTEDRGVSEVWQTKDLQNSDFGSVASKGLTGEFSDLWQIKDLAAFLLEVGVCAEGMRHTAQPRSINPVRYYKMT